MNLSPSWADRLARHGFEAVQLVHHQCCDRARRRDPDVCERAQLRRHDERPRLLGNSRCGRCHGPSVVQTRSPDLLSDVVVSIVAKALDAHREDIERGALLSIDEAGTRVRLLPLRRS
jgi:hypothetical protein